MGFLRQKTLAQNFEDALSGVAVAEGVDSACHLFVRSAVFEQSCGLAKDILSVGAHESRCSGFEGFGALSDLAHHQDGLAQRWGLLLDASRIRQDKKTPDP